MNSEELFNGISEIDGALLDEAKKTFDRNKKKGTVQKRIIIFSALCFAVIIIGFTIQKSELLKPSLTETTNQIGEKTVLTQKNEKTETTIGSYDSKAMKELAEKDQIGWVRYNGVLYIQDVSVGEVYINGEKATSDEYLCEVIDIEGFYKNLYEKSNEKSKVNGKVYSVKNVDVKDEIMIKLNGEDIFLMALYE